MRLWPLKLAVCMQNGSAHEVGASYSGECEVEHDWAELEANTTLICETEHSWDGAFWSIMNPPQSTQQIEPIVQWRIQRGFLGFNRPLAVGVVSDVTFWYPPSWCTCRNELCMKWLVFGTKKIPFVGYLQTRPGWQEKGPGQARYHQWARSFNMRLKRRSEKRWLWLVEMCTLQ